MAHSFDSTLLQRMGFKDPDRNTPAHDRACIEIACHPEKLLRALGITDGVGVKALLEQPLQKGEGKYASTVGFIDAMVEWLTRHDEPDWRRGFYENGYTFRCRCGERAGRIGECNCNSPLISGPTSKRDCFEKGNALLVEVKTKIDAIGDLLRQMNLYREYKQTHDVAGHRQYGRLPVVAPYVIWSLDIADDQYAPLLASQGYTLLVGPSLDRIEGAKP